MKKQFSFLLFFVLVSVLLYSQSVTLNNVGIKGPNGGSVTPGSRVNVKYEFTTTDYDEEFGIIEGASVTTASGTHGYVRIQWYSSTDASGTSLGYTDVAVGSLNYTGIENGVACYDTTGFALPTPPVYDPVAKTFKVRSRVWGDDGYGDIRYSSLVTSSSGLSGYSAYLTINTNTAPYATGVSISNPGFAKVGQTLNGTYTYNDADSDTESGTSFRWLKSSTESGTYSAISGATSQSYTVQSSDADYYLKFEVTPKAASGVSPGTAVLSSASSKVTEAACAEVSPNPYTLHEASTNSGTFGTAYVAVVVTNTSFVSGTISGITMNNLPAGLSVGTITRISGSEIRVVFSGSATEHEYAASILDPNTITVNIPANMLVGVSNAVTTSCGFYIQFNNNAPRNLAINSVGYNYVKITWDEPAGLKSSGSGIDYYKVWRNDSYIGQVNHDSAKGSYVYTDSLLSTGVANTYKVQAVYSAGGDDPFTNNLSATPVGFTAYAISSPSTTGTLDHVNKTAKIILPAGTSLSSLIATFTAPGATVKIGSTTQVSGTTSNNFSSPLVYTFTASDASTCSYSVTAYVKLAAPTTVESGFNETTSSFAAKWNAVSGATGYRLDVSTVSNFASFVPGYENYATTSTSQVVNGLSANTGYYYRVRATGASAELTSENSTSRSVSTNTTASGAGNTEVYNSDPTVVNVGSYATASHGTVIPSVTVNPDSFSSSADNYIAVSMGYGSSPQGLLYNLSFENASIGNGTFVLSYNGLSYDPTDVRYTVGGGDLTLPGSLNIDTNAKTITLGISGLSKDAKASYEIQIICNDQTGQTLPVVLTSFTATLLVQGQVRIDWITQSETGVMGFYVMRNTTSDLNSAFLVSPLVPATNTSSVAAYSFVDEEIPVNGVYYYWLQNLDLDGISSYFGPITILVNNGAETPANVPMITSLRSPFPNPFNPDITIPFDLATPATVQIDIFNSKGQLVNSLVNEAKQADSYRVVWNGKDDHDRKVSSGTYIVRMKAGNFESSRKVVMVK